MQHLIFLQNEQVGELEEGITSVRTEHSEDIVSLKTDLGDVRTDFEGNITSLKTDIVSLKLVDNLHSYNFLVNTVLVTS